MHRFYLPQAFAKNPHQGEISDAQEIHHLKDVLRLKKGDAVTLFDGEGQQAPATILKIEPARVVFQIGRVEVEPTAQPRIVLACAIPKKSKFETIIEKCTELGVDEIIPLTTERTVIKVPKEQIARKTERYRSVAVNAAKQSARNTVPRIRTICSFAEAVGSLPDDGAAFIPTLGEKKHHLRTALQKLSNPKTLTFFIGPEGDFTDREVELAQKKGAAPISLGRQVLKVDTAAITVTAAAMIHFRS